ncbi:uncharacterized protein METZ01_LOCUS227844, partial [marine metagenome]
MIVGIHGKMGTGKSTVADSLVEVLKDEFNINSTIKSFASPIYNLISLLFDETVEEIKLNKNTLVRPRSFMGQRTYRELLQNVGMFVRDNADVDIWINALFGNVNDKIIQDWTCNYKWWIIDDLRFQNEFKRIKDIGGINIKVNRDITNNLDDDIKNNGSEVDLDDLDRKEWDLFLDNNNTIDITKKILIEFIMTI